MVMAAPSNRFSRRSNARSPQLRLSSYHRFAFGFDYMVTGYEASVYAYEWSGVLATEAFKRFEEDGVFNPQTGRAFSRGVLCPWGF